MENKNGMNEMIKGIAGKNGGGIGTGGVIAIVAGAVGALGVGAVLVKKLVTHIRNNNAIDMPEDEIEIDEETLVDIATK